MKLNINNVLLVEKHDTDVQEAVLTEQKQITFVKGFKIFRLIKPLEEGKFEVLAQYDAHQDSTDLAVLKDFLGFYGCSVDYDRIDESGKKQFVWTIFQFVAASDDNQVFAIQDNRKCTSEEIDFLNHTFPEYYDHAF